MTRSDRILLSVAALFIVLAISSVAYFATQSPSRAVQSGPTESVAMDGTGIELQIRPIEYDGHRYLVFAWDRRISVVHAGGCCVQSTVTLNPSIR